MAGKENKEKKIEIIKYIMSEKTVAQTASYFGYKGLATVYKVLSAFKAMVSDYASNHTKNEVLEHYAEYRITEQWLNDNHIFCFSVDDKILKDYKSGKCLVEIALTCDVDEKYVREIVKTAKIPIREDEDAVDFGKGHITIEDNATDIGIKPSPQLKRGDIVFVNGAKYSWRKDKIPSDSARPAIVLSPQWQLNSGSDCVTVAYGTTQMYRTDISKNIIQLNKYYTGKEFCCQLTQIDTVSVTDIQYNESYPHLNDIDMTRVEEGLSDYFGISNQQDFDVIEISDEEISNMVISLFETGLNRNVIYDILKNSVYECDKALIQSILDKNGYAGVKQIDTHSECDSAKSCNPYEGVKEGDIELIKAQAKLSVYESIFSKVSSLNI